MKRILTLVLIVSVFASSLFLYDAKAASNIRVLLNNTFVDFKDVQPQIINDRTLVPFRVIGEAMGAVVLWDDSKKEVTMTLADNYVRLNIGNNIMYFGEYTTDSKGAFQQKTNFTYTLEAPAVIVDSRTLVPTRAIAEGLGAEVGWFDNTVIINSSLTAARPTPSPTPDVFQESHWFKKISTYEAQAMYDKGEQFIFAYYTTEDKNSKLYMPLIQDAAKESGMLVYGVDATADGYTTDRLTFIWKHIKKDSFEYPVVFTVNGQRDVRVVAKPSNLYTLRNLFTSFAKMLNNGALVGTTPVPSATPTPRPTAVPTPSNEFLIDIDRPTAERMLNEGLSFVYLYYYKGDSDSDKYFETVRKACDNTRIRIYATDVSKYNYSESEKWWGNPGGGFIYYPSVFFIKNTVVTDKVVQPTNVDTLAKKLSEH